MLRKAEITYIRPSDEVVRSLVKGFNDRVFDHIIREVDIESIPKRNSLLAVISKHVKSRNVLDERPAGFAA